MSFGSTVCYVQQFCIGKIPDVLQVKRNIIFNILDETINFLDYV